MEPPWPPLSSLLASDFLTTRPGNPDLLAVFVHDVADTGRLLGVRVDDLHVAHVDRRFLMDDAALLGAADALGDLGVLLHHVHALDEHALALGVGGDDRALAATV